MAQGTQGLTREIELTLQRLSADVDELSNKVSPREIAHRRKQAARSRIGGLRDKVMGSRDHVVGSTHQATRELAQETGPELVQAAERRFEGNPLAAGVVAFGTGVFLSALIPPTQAEQRLAQQGTEAAKEHAHMLTGDARDAAGNVEAARQGGQT